MKVKSNVVKNDSRYPANNERSTRKNGGGNHGHLMEGNLPWNSIDKDITLKIAGLSLDKCRKTKFVPRTGPHRKMEVKILSRDVIQGQQNYYYLCVRDSNVTVFSDEVIEVLDVWQFYCPKVYVSFEGLAVDA